ncbi:MAG: hypothetical protein PVI00_06905 [Desulfobacterales bacterium]|jgi:hypothetical protein
MKKFIIPVIAIVLLAFSAYADDHKEFKCDYKYYRGIKKVNSLYEMTEEARQKWILKLTEVHQLCMDGKDQEASKILMDLRNDKEWDTVFSTYDSN